MKRLKTVVAGITAMCLVASAQQQQQPAAGQAAPAQATPAQPAPAQPAPAQAAPGQATPAQAPAQTPPAPTPQAEVPTTLPPSQSSGGLNLQNASLVEVVDLLARQLKINYILDPRVRGAVTINTYGETKNLNNRALLDLILRINGAAMIQVGDVYRIVPLTEVKSLPLKPNVNAKDIPEDDSTMLNLIFLKYATVADLVQLITPFLGEGATTVAYPPANLLLVQDSRRNMRRLMELISLFDSNEFASQRVRLFEVKEGRPSDIAKELENVLKAISLNEKSAPIKFLPIDRINTIIAIAPNPGAFDEIEKWIRKLDVPMQITAGSVDNYVYRVKYGRAETLAMAIMQLYGGFGGYGYGGGMYGGMYGGGYGGGYGGMYGGGYGAPGMYGGAYGGAPGMYGGGYPQGMPGGAYGAPVYQSAPGAAGTGAAPTTGIPGTATSGAGAVTPAMGDQTGMYMGAGMGYGVGGRIPRIVPNPMDNTLLIQGTPQEYAGIMKLLKDLDVPPRQVLIEAKIYEVDLTGAFASGVQAVLQRRGATGTGAAKLDTRQLTGSLQGGFTNLSAGALVGASRELALFLAANEATSRAKVISAPSIIATDSIPASITVGTEVPTLSSSAATGIQQGGTSVFANNVTNRSTGVTLNVLARVNPSGIVTLVINQEVTAPQETTTSSINSPSFSKRSVQTQVTVADGDLIAIGGIINEANTATSAGIPLLHRLPIVGGAFGNRTYGKSRTELIVFMTPRVIYDTNEITEASEEVKNRVRKLRSMINKEP